MQLTTAKHCPLGSRDVTSTRPSGAAAEADSCTRSWVRRRFSLDVSLPRSTSRSAGEAAVLASGPLDHRRGGGVGGAFTGTGLVAFSCGAVFACRLDAIICNSVLQMSHPQSTQLLWLAGQEGFSHHRASKEAACSGGSLAAAADCEGVSPCTASWRGALGWAGSAWELLLAAVSSAVVC